MAIYLGFYHAYMVGFDYTHLPARARYWYEKGQGVYIKNRGYNKDFFGIATEFIDITTITLDDSSEFLNSETYKHHSGREPFYRENTEIVEQHYLKVLSTWPMYKIM